MLKIECAEVLGWEHSIRGLRNPLNSWEKSDSKWGYVAKSGEFCTGDCGDWCTGWQYKLGENDLKLMTKLRKAGPDHRKFMRMLTVYVDITAPLYWWKEFDTYKVGTVANSCSTMHKIHAKEFTLDDFSHEHLYGESMMLLESIVRHLNACRDAFTRTKEHHLPSNYSKQEWWQMIQLLPTSYNQKRTVMLNYEVLANIYHARRNHKLDEWHTLCDWIESLPYAKELIIGKGDTQ